jgi:hypothetical protein
MNDITATAKISDVTYHTVQSVPEVKLMMALQDMVKSTPPWRRR